MVLLMVSISVVTQFTDESSCNDDYQPVLA